jgi:hypothetical protein
MAYRIGPIARMNVPAQEPLRTIHVRYVYHR